MHQMYSAGSFAEWIKSSVYIIRTYRNMKMIDHYYRGRRLDIRGLDTFGNSDAGRDLGSLTAKAKGKVTPGDLANVCNGVHAMEATDTGLRRLITFLGIFRYA
jgi:hypothetical protein